jgi:hypothetical protein
MPTKPQLFRSVRQETKRSEVVERSAASKILTNGTERYNRGGNHEAECGANTQIGGDIFLRCRVRTVQMSDVLEINVLVGERLKRCKFRFVG